MAAPRKDEKERRIYRIVASVNQDQLLKAHEDARSMGMTLSDYIVHCLGLNDESVGEGSTDE